MEAVWKWEKSERLSTGVAPDVRAGLWKGPVKVKRLCDAADTGSCAGFGEVKRSMGKGFGERRSCSLGSKVWHWHLEKEHCVKGCGCGRGEAP